MRHFINKQGENNRFSMPSNPKKQPDKQFIAYCALIEA
jgi:hypothetical protein